VQEGYEGDKRVEKIIKRNKLLFLYHNKPYFSADNSSFHDYFLVVLRNTFAIERLYYLTSS